MSNVSKNYGIENLKIQQFPEHREFDNEPKSSHIPDVSLNNLSKIREDICVTF